MHPSLLAAGVAMVIAPWLRPFLWRVPTRMFSFGMVLRAALTSGLVAALVAYITSSVMPPMTAATAGVAVALVLAFLSARRSASTRGTALLCWRVSRREPGAIAHLEARLRRLKNASDADAHAHAVCFAAVPLTAVGEWERASQHLESIDTAALRPDLRERSLQALATVRLERSDLEGAQEAMDQITRPASGVIEEWLVASEALLYVVQGNTREALRRANEADASGALALTYEIVRAHACASHGDDTGAHRSLNLVYESAGAAGVERAVRPVGPATDIARQLLTEELAKAASAATEVDE